jgi:hypothetical protein
MNSAQGGNPTSSNPPVPSLLNFHAHCFTVFRLLPVHLQSRSTGQELFTPPPQAWSLSQHPIWLSYHCSLRLDHCSKPSAFGPSTCHARQVHTHRNSALQNLVLAFRTRRLLDAMLSEPFVHVADGWTGTEMCM